MIAIAKKAWIGRCLCKLFSVFIIILIISCVVVCLLVRIFVIVVVMIVVAAVVVPLLLLVFAVHVSYFHWCNVGICSLLFVCIVSAMIECIIVLASVINC